LKMQKINNISIFDGIPVIFNNQGYIMTADYPTFTYPNGSHLLKFIILHITLYPKIKPKKNDVIEYFNTDVRFIESLFTAPPKQEEQGIPIVSRG